MSERPVPDCKLRDPNSTRNCPYSIYCATCDMDDEDAANHIVDNFAAIHIMEMDEELTDLSMSHLDEPWP